MLKRFDVYYNRKLKVLRSAGQAIGGAIGGAITDAAQRNDGNFTFKDLVVDTDPLQPKGKDVKMVGCDDRHEGEYDPSLISGGHDVLVTWFHFTIDGKEYHLRSFYQFQPENPQAVGPAAALAVERTVEAISGRIEL